MSDGHVGVTRYRLGMPDDALSILTGAVEAARCPRRVVDHAFADGVDHSVWSGGDGNIVHWEAGAMVVHDLRQASHGLKLDLT